MLAISISEKACVFRTRTCALSLASARLAGACKAAVVCTAWIAVVASVAGAAVRSILASRCVALLLLLVLECLLCVFDALGFVL